MKKIYNSVKGYLDSEPAIINKNPDGSLFIPIEALENDLDFFLWSTKNYKSEPYLDIEGDLSVFASLELSLLNNEFNNDFYNQTFVGSCNFKIKSLLKNPHWNATAKSECIKNAASEAGIRFGRGLNKDMGNTEKEVTKKEPDAGIISTYMEAVKNKNEAVVKNIESIYNIKIG